MSAPTWVWVKTRTATYGVICRDGKVIDAAPIARWLIGLPEEVAAARLRKAGAEFVVLGSDNLADAL